MRALERWAEIFALLVSVLVAPALGRDRVIAVDEFDGKSRSGLLAGRCSSGDFIAHASCRMAGNVVAMREAAGASDAVAAVRKLAPHDVNWNEANSVVAKTRNRGSQTVQRE